MDIREGFAGAVGKTPLIRLKGLSEECGCEILGKAEFLNPGGSIKDRTALGLILDAEKRGQIRPGGVIVEGTAGNTGIGLALVGRARGYRTVIVMPETQSREKIEMLRLSGAEVRLVPAVPYRNPENYVHQSRRLAEALSQEETAGAFWANQFDNTANRDFHAATTGPEIWQQTDGRVDAFVCAAGTGGTLAGVGRYLQSQRAGIQTGLADPAGSAVCSLLQRGEAVTEGNSISEGIGNSRITANLEGARIDQAWTIPDEESLPLVWRMMEEEGLMLGSSSGVNLAGALRMAESLGRGHTIVTMLCDSALRYRAKLFNPDFLQEKGLPFPTWLRDAVKP
ncbi:cysteine synthase A [Natronospira bacteriovora]|uniref:cysteine synthase n=1 Tax=Natronospira bacteriovora TaxID=3069753 RepID=A0ABU0W3Z6_9GAMM|nr:cysteine synthase A [Natronospira sp. AB-CW4]MDQ2068742.1 cysteine synthase A [Natronospira sp. AB-CW4]